MGQYQTKCFSNRIQTFYLDIDQIWVKNKMVFPRNCVRAAELSFTWTEVSYTKFKPLSFISSRWISLIFVGRAVLVERERCKPLYEFFHFYLNSSIFFSFFVWHFFTVFISSTLLVAVVLLSLLLVHTKLDISNENAFKFYFYFLIVLRTIWNDLN